MTEKRILVSTDNNALSTFKKDVTDVCDRSNELITLFHAFQKWERIKTIEAAEELMSDPQKAFDAAIIRNVQVTASGLTVDPEQAALLFNVSRSEFLNLCAGLSIPDDSQCVPCQQVKIRKGKRVISLNEFNRYRDYLTFTTAGFFTVNTTAVDADLDRFNYYISTPEEVEIYNLYHDTVKLLNRITELSPITPAERQTIKTALKLHLSEGHAGSFMVNTETLKNAINKLKYQNNGTNGN